MDLATEITRVIKETVARAGGVTPYREPLVGFAPAHDHLFTRIKSIIGPHHLHPLDLLPGAQTLVAFFIPFGHELIIASRASSGVAREWAVAYIETNQLISDICAKLIALMEAKGIEAVAERPTHNFNEQDLTAGWSHKSMAFVAGLGTFGVHKMLITPAGCAGRCGSLVLAAKIKPTGRPDQEFCRYHRTGECLHCVRSCPTGALKETGLDKQVCYRHLLEVDRRFSDLGLCDVCGKCALGPCAEKPC